MDSDADELLIKAHEAGLLSPLEVLDELGVAEFGDLVVPDGEGEGLEEVVDDGHHVSPGATDEREGRARTCTTWPCGTR